MLSAVSAHISSVILGANEVLLSSFFSFNIYFRESQVNQGQRVPQAHLESPA